MLRTIEIFAILPRSSCLFEYTSLTGGLKGIQMKITQNPLSLRCSTARQNNQSLTHKKTNTIRCTDLSKTLQVEINKCFQYVNYSHWWLVCILWIRSTPVRTWDCFTCKVNSFFSPSSLCQTLDEHKNVIAASTVRNKASLSYFFPRGKLIIG